MKDLKIASETDPTFVFGKEGFNIAHAKFWEKKKNYLESKRMAIIAFCWLLLFIGMTFYIPFVFGSIWLIILFRSLYIHKKLSTPDERDLFINELKKQPWK